MGMKTIESWGGMQTTFAITGSAFWQRAAAGAEQSKRLRMIGACLVDSGGTAQGV